MVFYSVPIYKSLLKHSKPWKVAGNVGIFDKNLSQAPDLPNSAVSLQLGIPAGSKVLFFAASYGDWANALSQTTELTYADVSKSMVSYAKRRFNGKGIKKFTVADALLWPKRGEFDYLVSYVPIPLKERLPLIVLRALALAKGIRILSPGSIDAALFRQYDPRARVEKIKIPTTDGIVKMPVFFADSSVKTRFKAKVDLAAIGFLQGKEKTTVEKIRKELQRKGLGATKNDIRNSLRRICRLSFEIHGLLTNFGFEDHPAIKVVEVTP